MSTEICYIEWTKCLNLAVSRTYVSGRNVLQVLTVLAGVSTTLWQKGVFQYELE